MAHLEVQPKPSRPWWVWLLIVLLVILLAGMLLRKCSSEEKTATADTTAADSSGMPLAKTVPDWNSVDFNSATQTDQDITDADIQTRSSGTYTIYTLGENILFPTAGNDISENGMKKLQHIATVLNNRFSGATVGIFGSTDDSGPAQENRELGKQRATAVKAWLSARGNVPAETLSVQTLGETEPVAPNDTKSGRQQNRNVSIVVFPKQ